MFETSQNQMDAMNVHIDVLSDHGEWKKFVQKHINTVKTKKQEQYQKAHNWFDVYSLFYEVLQDPLR